MNHGTALAEYLRRQTQCAQTPVDKPEDVGHGTVTAMEKNGDYRYAELFDKTDYIRLPLTVFKTQVFVDLRHGASREESYRLSGADLLDRSLDTKHGYCLFLRILARIGIDRNKIGTHGRYMVEHHIDHHLESGATLSDDIDQTDPVKRSERVVAHCDERSFRKILEHLKTIDAQFYIQIAQQPFNERNSRSGTIVTMQFIDFINIEPPKQAVYQFLMPLQLRHHPYYVVAIQDIGLYLILLVLHLFYNSHNFATKIMNFARNPVMFHNNTLHKVVSLWQIMPKFAQKQPFPMSGIQKTNAARLLDKAKIAYRLVPYTVDPDNLAADHVAEELGEDIRQVFKTLVLHGDKSGYFVCVVPGDTEVDLKAAAKAAGAKKAEMIPMKELLPLTGYIRGGCSPIGMKKAFPTFFHTSALDFDKIYVSAGVRGLQLCISPRDLIDYVRATVADLTIKQPHE